MRLLARSTPITAAPAMICAAHDALEWEGFVLPKIQMSGGAVYPVVAWTRSAARRRMEGPEPTTCRPTLSAWEVDGPPSAVRIVGFLHAGAPVDGIDRLKAVAAYGPGVIVVSNAARVGRWTMAEADLASISVVEAHADGTAQFAVRGRDTPLPTARRSVATRLREEQMYQWALQVGAEPGDSIQPAPASTDDPNLVS